MMRSAGLLALAAALAVASAPGSAKITKPQAAPAPPSAGAGAAGYRDVLGEAIALGQRGDCRGMLAKLDPLLPAVEGKDRVPVQLLRISCLAQVGRGGEVPAIYRELAAIDPDNGGVRSVGVIVAASDKDYILAGTRLAALAEEKPEALPAIDSNLARGIAQMLTEKRDYRLRDRMYVALARADWQPLDRPEMRDSIAQGAIEALLADKQVEEARVLLPRVTMPEILAGMATERRYEPLWPDIEARLGPNSGKAVDRFAAARLDAFAQASGDDRARRDAIRAFVLLGRLQEAAELAGQVQIAEGIDEDGVAAARYEAQALSAQGKRAQAIARMQGFARLDLAKSPAAVSGLVSLAEMLDENGQPADALAVTRATLARSGEAISRWGVGWLKRTEVCALGALGRREEANRLGDALAAASADNEAASIEGLLCLGRADDAAKIAVAALGLPDGASRLADQFQPDGALFASSPSRLRALWVPFLARADVRRAFDKAARILPQALWPAREPRPIPRARTGEDAGPIA